MDQNFEDRLVEYDDDYIIEMQPVRYISVFLISVLEVVTEGERCGTCADLYLMRLYN